MTILLVLDLEEITKSLKMASAEWWHQYVTYRLLILYLEYARPY